MEEYEHYSMGGPASPCIFLTKPTHPPRSSNTQGLAGPLLYFLSAILGIEGQIKIESTLLGLGLLRGFLQAYIRREIKVGELVCFVMNSPCCGLN